MTGLRFLLRWVGALTLIACSGASWSASDVGLINQLQGEISYQGGSAISHASPYMKVRAGDRFTIAAGAVLRLVYFGGK